MSELNVKRRIGKITSFLMIFIAIILDIIEFILALFLVGAVVNRIMTILEYPGYWLWFKIKGVSFTKNRKIAGRMGSTFIAEIIPFIGALPMFTVGVWLTIKETIREDIELTQKEHQTLVSQTVIRQKRG